MSIDSPKLTGDIRVKIIPQGDNVFRGLSSTNNKRDIGPAFLEFEHASFQNGGHVIYTKLHDPYFNIINNLVGGSNSNDPRSFYLDKTRREPIALSTRVGWVPEGTGDLYLETRQTVTYIVGMSAYGDNANNSYVELISIDPGSWALNEGDCSGKAYDGNVSQVMTQVLSDYINDEEFADVTTEVVGKTQDSEYNTWWMMRQDPRTFLMSLLEWSAAVSEKRSQWMVVSDSYSFKIVEQAAHRPSERKAVYRYRGAGIEIGLGFGDIYSWELLSDHTLSLTSHKVVTNGISAVSGAYYDRISDSKEEAVFVKDSTTSNKLKAKTSKRNAPTAKNDEKHGYTSYPAMPELSGGEMGMRYDKFIDGYARNAYLNLNNALFRAKFTIMGHHIWDLNEGLGVDTIYIDWKNIDGEPYFMDGNWIVYGFKHRVSRVGWFTDVFCARLDWDSDAKQVPGT